MLADAEGRHLRIHALDFPESRGIFTEGTLVPIEGTIPGKAFLNRKPIVVNRLDPAEMPPEMYRKAIGEGLNSFCDVPLISKNRLLGVLAVARREENAFDEDEVAFLTQVANQVAIAVDNARVKFYDANHDGTADTPKAGDRVKVKGRITRLAKKCDQTGFTPKITVRRVEFKPAKA